MIHALRAIFGRWLSHAGRVPAPRRLWLCAGVGWLAAASSIVSLGIGFTGHEAAGVASRAMEQLFGVHVARSDAVSGLSELSGVAWDGVLLLGLPLGLAFGAVLPLAAIVVSAHASWPIPTELEPDLRKNNE